MVERVGAFLINHAYFGWIYRLGNRILIWDDKRKADK
jgi:hypothetical protein